MQLDLFQSCYDKFESVWEKDESGVEFIYARNLMETLGYAKWEKFQNPIEKAREACKNSENRVEDHFLHVGKMVTLGSGSERKIDDVKLTRYACYLIAMNGDSRKSEVAFAQNYFAVQTRKFELIIERMEQMERIDSRNKLKESEKEFSRVIYERGVTDPKVFSKIKSQGDEAFYGGNTTQEMKQKLGGIKATEPLADYTNKAINLGKALANTMTTMNVEGKDLRGEIPITKEHIASNTNVRKAMTDTGVYPEKLPAEESIKKIESKIKKEEKDIAKLKATKSPKKLD